MMWLREVKVWLVCSVLGAGLLGVSAAENASKEKAKERKMPELAVDNAPVKRDGTFTTSFAPVIKKASASVVNIFTTRQIKGSELRGHPLLEDPLFRRFFGDPEQNAPRNRREQSLGSGVIVSADGYILTSNHVVEGSDEIRIVMADQREFKATIVGGDSATDTAVLKVEETGLPAITMANSDALEVGDVVLAIGNPFGIGQTVTMGIVSATGRGDLGIVDYEDFIQTDASINPGNSGGALVDAQGRLVGINTAILSRTGGNMGVGFAIPVNMSRHVMERLVTQGKVTRGFLGVGIQPVARDMVTELKLPDATGALVTSVEPKTPAAQAGVKPYDVIVEYNGKKVSDNRHLRLMVSQTAPGTEITIKVLRDGEPETFKMKLGELPANRMAGGLRGPDAETEDNETLQGVEVGDLDARARRQFNIPAHIQGVLVTNVDPESKAAEAGLAAGDVILEMDRKTVTSAEEAVELSQDFKGERILLRVWSKGATKVMRVENGSNTPTKKKEEER